MSTDYSKSIYYGTLISEPRDACDGWNCTTCVIITIVVMIVIAIVIAAIVIGWLLHQWETWKQETIRTLRVGQAKGVYQSCANPADLGPVQQFPTTVVDLAATSYQPQMAAYLLQVAIQTTQDSCRPDLAPIVPPGFTQYREMRSINPFDNKERPVATAFWSIDAQGCMDTLLISFNGTKFLDQWITDIRFLQQPPNQLNDYQDGMLVHNGFYESYLSIRDQVLDLLQYQPRRYLLAGHSLGGATSTIAALDTAAWNPTHYSFASPRVGNPAFAAQYQALLPYGQRVVNLSDDIPELPPPVLGKIVYQHVPNLVYFTENLGTIYDNHITAYVNNVVKAPL